MNHPVGKGVFIWQLDKCAGGNPAELARQLASLGFTWAAVKLANGMADFKPELVGPAFEALALAGVSPWAWHYIYGGNIITGASIAKQEAAAAVRNIQRFGPAGWIIDPEGEYKRKGAAGWANTYMTAVRAAYPDLPIGLCSYRWPSYHPELPWRDFTHYCDFHAPQVYWLKARNPGEQLRRSARELTAIRDLPVVPVGSAFAEHGWQPQPGELDEFDRTAQELGLPGVSWWCWDDHGLEEHPEYRARIKAHEWGTASEPHAVDIEDWAPEFDAWAREKIGYLGNWPKRKGK